MAYGIEYKLTKEQALFIKKLRVTDTWRSIAREVAEQYPELGVCAGNQIDGMALCDAAMKLLGETVEDGWN